MRSGLFDPNMDAGESKGGSGEHCFWETLLEMTEIENKVGTEKDKERTSRSF